MHGRVFYDDDAGKGRRLIRKVVPAIMLLLIIILVLAGVIGPGPRVGLTAGGEWLPGWAYRVPLTIDSAEISSNLEDFPLLVHLSAASGIGRVDASFVFDTLKRDADRKKIAITGADGITQLYVEIQKWDSGDKQAWLWVKVPKVSSEADTLLYLYYDAAQTDNTDMVGDTGSEPAQNVWDGSFVMVQHLDEAGNGAPGEYKDSTSKRHSGTGGGGVRGDAPGLVPGIIADGQGFDGTGDHIRIDDHDDFSVPTTGELTISAWVSPSVLDFPTANDGYIFLMGKGAEGRYEWSFVFYSKNGNVRPQRISFYIDNPWGGLGTGSYTQDTLIPGGWVYLTAKVDSRQTHVYRNGVLSRSDDYVGPNAFVVIDPKNGTEPVRIGTRNMTSWFQGSMDEVRISNVSRSDAWIAASYYSENDRLVRFGKPDDGALVLGDIGDKAVDVGQLLSFTVSAADPRGMSVTYSAIDMPVGATLNTSTGQFSWRPAPGQEGKQFRVVFTASNGDFTDSEEVTFTVNKRIASPEPATPTASSSPTTTSKSATPTPAGNATSTTGATNTTATTTAGNDTSTVSNGGSGGSGGRAIYVSVIAGVLVLAGAGAIIIVQRRRRDHLR